MRAAYQHFRSDWTYCAGDGWLALSTSLAAPSRILPARSQWHVQPSWSWWLCRRYHCNLTALNLTAGSRGSLFARSSGQRRNAQAQPATRAWRSDERAGRGASRGVRPAAGAGRETSTRTMMTIQWSLKRLPPNFHRTLSEDDSSLIQDPKDGCPSRARACRVSCKDSPKPLPQRDPSRAARGAC